MNWEKGCGVGRVGGGGGRGRGLSCVLCNSYVVWSGILILLVEKTRTESQRSRSVSYTAVAQKKLVAVD